MQTITYSFNKHLVGSYSVPTRAELPTYIWGPHSPMREMDLLTDYRHKTQGSGPQGYHPGVAGGCVLEGSLRLVGGVTMVDCICQAKRRPGGLWARHRVSQTPTHAPLFCRSRHSAKPVSSVRLRGVSTVQSHWLCVPRICFVSAPGLSRWEASGGPLAGSP